MNQFAATDGRPRDYLRTNSLCLPRQEQHHASLDLLQFLRLPWNVHDTGGSRMPGFAEKQMAQLVRDEMAQNHAMGLLVGCYFPSAVGEHVGHHTVPVMHRQ